MLLSSHWKRRPILVGRIFHPGRSRGCCPVRATGGPLPCGRYLLAPLTGSKEGSSSLMVLRVKPTPTRFPTNSLYTPMGNTPLHSISSVCHPWDRDVTVARLREQSAYPRASRMNARTKCTNLTDTRSSTA